MRLKMETSVESAVQIRQEENRMENAATIVPGVSVIDVVRHGWFMRIESTDISGRIKFIARLTTNRNLYTGLVRDRRENVASRKVSARTRRACRMHVGRGDKVSRTRAAARARYKSVCAHLSRSCIYVENVAQRTVKNQRGSCDTINNRG